MKTYRATGPGEEDQVDVDDLIGVRTGLLLEPTSLAGVTVTKTTVVTGMSGSDDNDGDDDDGDDDDDGSHDGGGGGVGGDDDGGDGGECDGGSDDNGGYIGEGSYRPYLQS